ncbi:MAG: 2-oxo acid dehydrogenase subunit E2 [Christensenellales bacterium]|jgi:pyruvate dehydrogenase E2 component (dihydrolipoamide acetyltransferase)
MAYFVLLPQKGLTEESAVLSAWHVEEGDQVKEGDDLFDIETGKATFSVESETAGTVLEIIAKEGQEIPIKSVVCVIGSKGETYTLPGSENAVPEVLAPQQDSVTFVLMPQKGLTEESAVLSAWHVKRGDQVKEGDILFDIETGKATFSVESEAAGTVLQTIGNEGDEIPIKSVVCVIGPKEAKYSLPQQNSQVQNKASLPEETKPQTAPPLPDGNGRIFISPPARILAEQLGIDIRTVIPSGEENRITVDDVKQAAQKRENSKPDENAVAEYRVVKNSNIRKITARNMMRSLQGMAQFTLHSYFDATSILSLREKYKEDNIDISLSSMIVFAISRTILAYPELNAHFTEEETKLFSDVHVGVAVDTKNGLIVPTVFEANKKSLPQISGQIKSLAQKCRDDKIMPDEITGGTFTISNLGAANITYFTPIIVPPQTAILGVGNIEYKPMLSDRRITFLPSMNVSLTIDHRAVDGAPAARYLKILCGVLEDFTSILT